MTIGNTSTLSYKSHLLLGRKPMGETFVLARWDYTPTEKDVQDKVASAAKLYDAFVLVTPCGPVLPGNFEMQSYQM